MLLILCVFLVGTGIGVLLGGWCGYASGNDRCAASIMAALQCQHGESRFVTERHGMLEVCQDCGKGRRWIEDMPGGWE